MTGDFHETETGRQAESTLSSKRLEASGAKDPWLQCLVVLLSGGHWRWSVGPGEAKDVGGQSESAGGRIAPGDEHPVQKQRTIQAGELQVDLLVRKDSGSGSGYI